MKITVTTDGVHELAHDLESVPAEKLPEIRRVVSRGALAVKKDLADGARSSGSYRHFHRSIDYDLDGLSAEIGPNKSKVQGALGNILYFGTSKNAPVLDLTGPLEREAPKFEKALADVAEDLL